MKTNVIAFIAGVCGFCLFTMLVSCKKDPTPCPPLDLNSINGRWAQVNDTTAHFYIDSLTATGAIIRTPALLNAPLETYSRWDYLTSIAKDTIYLRANAIPGKYSLYRRAGKWYGQVFLQNMDRRIEAVEIMQIDNNTDQPGPAPIKPL